MFVLYLIKYSRIGYKSLEFTTSKLKSVEETIRAVMEWKP